MKLFHLLSAFLVLASTTSAFVSPAVLSRLLSSTSPTTSIQADDSLTSLHLLGTLGRKLKNLVQRNSKKKGRGEGFGVPLDNISEAVGNTPLIKISDRLCPAGRTIYAKAEYFNPLSSVKDRLALSIIETAEQEGKLKPGDTVIEATSGNTGIAVAMMCAQVRKWFVLLVCLSVCLFACVYIYIYYKTYRSFSFCIFI